MNIAQIIKAWIIAYKPSEKQVELAKLRGDVCHECPARKEFISFNICSECGCPIGKKIFTDEYNPCPMGKWKDVDLKYFENDKKNKTLL